MSDMGGAVSSGERKVRVRGSPLYWAKAVYRYWRGTLDVDLKGESKQEATAAADALYLLGRWAPRVGNTVVFISICSLAVVFALAADFEPGNLASLYTFGAILQGFAALLAITGTFVIFRLQSLDREIERQEDSLSRLVEEIENIGRDNPVIGVRQYNAEQVIQMLEALEARGEPERGQQFDRDAMRRELKTSALLMSAEGLRQRALMILLGPSTEKVRFRGLFMKPLVLLTLTIVASLVLLPLSQNVHEHPATERGFLASVSLLALWTTIATGRFVWTAVQARKPEGPEALNRLFEGRMERQRDRAAAGANADASNKGEQGEVSGD